MPIGTSEGKQYDSDFDYWHEQLFGEPKQDAGGEGKMFFVRHGDTNCNDEDVVHGWVSQGLNDRGIEQAHKTAESLKDKKVTRIVSSDLPRAKQTANILAKELGVEVTFDPRLRTWDSGDFDYTHDHKGLEAYTKPVSDKLRDLTLAPFKEHTWQRNPDTFDQRFEGEPKNLAMRIPGEVFNKEQNRGYRDTLKEGRINSQWPTDKPESAMTTPYYPDAADSYGSMWITPESGNK